MVWLSADTYGEVEQELARLRAEEEQRQNALLSQPLFTPYSLPGEPGAMASPEYLYDSPSGGVYSAPGGGYYVGNDYYAQLPDLWAGTELAGGGGGYPSVASSPYYADPASSGPTYLYDSPSGGVYSVPGGGYYVGNEYYAGQVPDLWAGREFQQPVEYGPMAPYSNAAGSGPSYLYDSPAGGVYSAPGGGTYVGNDYYAAGQQPDLWAGMEFQQPVEYGPMAPPYSNPANGAPLFLYDSPAGGVYSAPGGGQYVGNDYHAGQAPDLWAGLEFQQPVEYGPVAPYSDPAWQRQAMYDSGVFDQPQTPYAQDLQGLGDHWPKELYDPAWYDHSTAIGSDADPSNPMYGPLDAAGLARQAPIGDWTRHETRYETPAELETRLNREYLAAMHDPRIDFMLSLDDGGNPGGINRLAEEARAAEQRTFFERVWHAVEPVVSGNRAVRDATHSRVDLEKLPWHLGDVTDAAIAPATWITAGLATGPTLGGRIGALGTREIAAALLRQGARETASGAIGNIAGHEVDARLPEGTPWWIRTPVDLGAGALAGGVAYDPQGAARLAARGAGAAHDAYFGLDALINEPNAFPSRGSWAAGMSRGAVDDAGSPIISVSTKPGAWGLTMSCLTS